MDLLKYLQRGTAMKRMPMTYFVSLIFSFQFLPAASAALILQTFPTSQGVFSTLNDPTTLSIDIFDFSADSDTVTASLASTGPDSALSSLSDLEGDTRVLRFQLSLVNHVGFAGTGLGAPEDILSPIAFRVVGNAGESGPSLVKLTTDFAIRSGAAAALFNLNNVATFLLPESVIRLDSTIVNTGDIFTLDANLFGAPGLLGDVEATLISTLHVTPAVAPESPTLGLFVLGSMLLVMRLKRTRFGQEDKQ